jgi:rhomboid protease GluP
MYGYAPAIQRFFGARLDLVTIITTACVVLYAVCLALEPQAILRMRGIFSFLSPGDRALLIMGMTGGIAWQERWWWTLFTAIYLHGGLLHIFFNVMWIRNLGPPAIDAFGPARMFVIFTIAGVVGFLVSNFASRAYSVGASGSIFGLLAALIVYGRRHGSSMMTAQLWQWAIIMFAMGFLMSGVNNWAHAGGFAGGWVTAEFVGSHEDRREGMILRVLAFALLAATLYGFVVSFSRVFAILMAG